jgi:hypothetical protein
MKLPILFTLTLAIIYQNPSLKAAAVAAQKAPPLARATINDRRLETMARLQGLQGATQLLEQLTSKFELIQKISSDQAKIIDKLEQQLAQRYGTDTHYPAYSEVSLTDKELSQKAKQAPEITDASALIRQFVPLLKRELEQLKAELTNKLQFELELQRVTAENDMLDKLLDDSEKEKNKQVRTERSMTSGLRTVAEESKEEKKHSPPSRSATASSSHLRSKKQ